MPLHLDFATRDFDSTGGLSPAKHQNCSSVSHSKQQWQTITQDTAAHNIIK